MNRDDIIRMARESGWPDSMVAPIIMSKLAEFAKVVAASEREAVAQMVEDTPALIEFVKNDKGGCMVCGFTPKMAAAAIRARGQA